MGCLYLLLLLGLNLSKVLWVLTGYWPPDGCNGYPMQSFNGSHPLASHWCPLLLKSGKITWDTYIILSSTSCVMSSLPMNTSFIMSIYQTLKHPVTGTNHIGNPVMDLGHVTCWSGLRSSTCSLLPIPGRWMMPSACLPSQVIICRLDLWRQVNHLTGRVPSSGLLEVCLCTDQVTASLQFPTWVGTRSQENGTTRHL